jgi:hypothetical protein
MVRDGGVNERDSQSAYEILLWFAFIGVILTDDDAKYIYSFGYDFKLFLATINKLKKDGISYQVNPAFSSGSTRLDRKSAFVKC